MNSDHVEHIQSILKVVYPEWAGLTDPRFVSDEIEYKREAIEKASGRLSQSALKHLVESGQHTEVIERLEEVGHSTNLMFLSMPQHGDMNVLYDPDLDKAEFAHRVLDLLYGDGTNPERLSRYSAWLDEQGLPNKWTFATYFLFLTQPVDNLFVKPSATGEFLKLVDADFEMGSTPDGELYGRLLELGAEVNQSVLQGQAEDMVPVQSVMWIVGHHGPKIGAGNLDTKRRETLGRLLDEFAESFLPSEEGQDHLSMYPRDRESGQENFKEVLEAHKSGQDITDLVLTKLLPHRDTATNRARGAWIHHAPAINGDVKGWFEAAGWVDPPDWPEISQAIFKFVRTVHDDPSSLRSACDSFAKSDYNTGFQQGMLTPILSALRPWRMALVNNKSRGVINHFLDLSYSQGIDDYPDLNTAAHYLIDCLRQELGQVLPSGVTPEDGFDAFTHWLVAIRRYRLGREQVWKISVSGPEEWDAWVEGGYVALNEEVVEDLAGTKKKDWEERRAALLEEVPDITGDRLDELWVFANQPQEGDRILVARGTDRVEGFGMVAGPYAYHKEAEPRHRVPVEWLDTRARAISEPAWGKRFHEVDGKKAEAVTDTPPIEESQSEGAFTPRAFELLSALHETPTREFYNEHKEDFHEHVEEPVKELLTGVAPRLPTVIKETMETQRYLFSQIPKNDWGQGGAWDFYWGAFYPRGSKRTTGAQLYIWVNRDKLEYGFYIGEYGEEQRSRFMNNVRKRRDALTAALAPHFDSDLFLLGEQRDEEGNLVGQGAGSLQEWFKEIDEAALAARVVVPKADLLQTPLADLQDKILHAYQQLFPLILVATSEDPLTAISEYWEPVEGEGAEIQPEYSLEECADATGFDVATIRRWVEATDRKRQAVFYGPPGTGKTHMAEHVARHMVGGGGGFTELVQFHPAYAYEDFIQGIRPITRAGGELEYKMVPGRFLEFCRKAQNRSGTSVLIIDEINRANLSRVFGELMYLLEYREEQIPLSSGGTFRIPENVRIIGTMNTADRSIALVDHALRRRFAFIPLRPRFEVLRRFHQDTGQSVEPVIERLTQINKAIGDPNYHLGITFFMEEELETQLEVIWRLEIEPYLEEYFFDDAATVERFRWDKIGEELAG